ncbi:hypothetical protein UlMin_024696 [Ulmus minor]
MEQAGGKSVVGKGFSNWKKNERLVEHVGNRNSYHYQCYKKYFAFGGHDESEDSSNHGNFLEILNFLADHIEEVRAIQKDIVNACAVETINVIIRDMGDATFFILVDESRDVSIKEQMVVMFRYVDKKGYVIESFIGIEHVANTTVVSLKIAIDKLFSKYGLSISRLRGQGYDGASNMISNVVNIVGASSKHRDILREKHALKVIEALKSGELSSGKGLNREIGIKHPCDTCWGTHFGTLVSFITMFSSIVDLSSRFNEANTELLLCLACLSPNNSFYAFDKTKLIRLAQLYSYDFSTVDLRVLENQLQIYVDDLRSNDKFSELKGIANLAKRLVETRKHEVYPLVYFLIKLALTLLVVTTSVERVFSAMNIGQIVPKSIENKRKHQSLQ